MRDIHVLTTTVATIEPTTSKGQYQALYHIPVLLQDTSEEPKARQVRSKLVFLRACVGIMTRTDVQHSSIKK
jgi:hypothetical protein